MHDPDFFMAASRVFRTWVLPFISLLLLSCNAEDARPDDVLDQNEMTRLMIQVHLAEAKAINAGLPLDSSAIMFQVLQDRYLQKMHLDTATVNRSFRYYASQPDQYDKIMERVIDSLGQRNANGNDGF